MIHPLGSESFVYRVGSGNPVDEIMAFSHGGRPGLSMRWWMHQVGVQFNQEFRSRSMGAFYLYSLPMLREMVCNHDIPLSLQLSVVGVPTPGTCLLDYVRLSVVPEERMLFREYEQLNQVFLDRVIQEREAAYPLVVISPSGPDTNNLLPSAKK